MIWGKGHTDISDVGRAIAKRRRDLDMYSMRKSINSHCYRCDDIFMLTAGRAKERLNVMEACNIILAHLQAFRMKPLEAKVT